MILGLSFFHNATACIVDSKEQKVLFCCSEERFSRRKNEWGIPYKTLEYIFENIISKEKISYVAVGESCKSLFGSRDFVDMMYLGNLEEKDSYTTSILKLAYTLTKEITCRFFRPKYNYQNIVKEKLQNTGINSRIVFMDHHKSHAASGFYCSPFKDALVVTLDGEGDGLSGSCWYGSFSDLTLLHTLPEVASVGKFYRSITSLLGFKVNGHEGKITGLAAYGNPHNKYYLHFKDLLYTKTDDGGRKNIISKIAELHMQNFNIRKVNIIKLMKKYLLLFKSKGWENLLNLMLREQFRHIYEKILDNSYTNLNFKEMSNIAFAAQQVLENVVLDYIKFYLDQVETKNVVLAGGVFANVKLNQKILERLDTEQIYIHPGMGDEGLALGAAMLCLHKMCKGKKKALESVYLGPSYNDNSIKSQLKKKSFPFKRHTDRDLIEIIANVLVEEKIVGLFRGRLEYGPRALGHRTILANPTNMGINEILSKKLRRTEFMPFAPVVLQECYDNLFESSKLNGANLACKFMTIALKVKPEWAERIQSVVHVDGTIRPQVITEKDDYFYYGIVKRFYEKTGIGCIVNTSFNIHEEPIVNSPYDALRSFENGAVDILIMENYLVQQK